MNQEDTRNFINDLGVTVLADQLFGKNVGGFYLQRCLEHEDGFEKKIQDDFEKEGIKLSLIHVATLYSAIQRKKEEDLKRKERKEGGGQGGPTDMETDKLQRVTLCIVGKLNNLASFLDTLGRNNFQHEAHYDDIPENIKNHHEISKLKEGINQILKHEFTHGFDSIKKRLDSIQKNSNHGSNELEFKVRMNLNKPRECAMRFAKEDLFRFILRYLPTADTQANTSMQSRFLRETGEQLQTHVIDTAVLIPPYITKFSADQCEIRADESWIQPVETIYFPDKNSDSAVKKPLDLKPDYLVTGGRKEIIRVHESKKEFSPLLKLECSTKTRLLAGANLIAQRQYRKNYSAQGTAQVQEFTQSSQPSSKAERERTFIQPAPQRKQKLQLDKKKKEAQSQATGCSNPSGQNQLGWIVTSYRLGEYVYYELVWEEEEEKGIRICSTELCSLRLNTALNFVAFANLEWFLTDEIIKHYKKLNFHELYDDYLCLRSSTSGSIGNRSGSRGNGSRSRGKGLSKEKREESGSNSESKSKGQAGKSANAAPGGGEDILEQLNISASADIDISDVLNLGKEAPRNIYILERMHESSRSIVYYVRMQDGRYGFLKVARGMRTCENEVNLLKHIASTEARNVVPTLLDFGPRYLVLKSAGTSFFLGSPHLSRSDLIELSWRLIHAVLVLHREASIAHRDLKNGNFIWDHKSRQVKLIDLEFGTLKRYDDEHCGTEGYMAPEIVEAFIKNTKYDTKLVDSFALGKTIVAMWGANEIPNGLNAIVKGLCDANPNDRWSLEKDVAAHDWFCNVRAVHGK
mmetsp:Transcript_27498/g.38212  ORF Transcript_27498/g.38212 Transcript_27498/m.38212 type:complete len:804 (+) Transcript_27498:341-2752(+)